MNTKAIYSQHFCNTIKRIKESDPTAVIVVIGDTSIINIEESLATIVHPESFKSNAGAGVFDKALCKSLYKNILDYEGQTCILSLAQFTYLTRYYSVELLDSKVYFVKDNLRSFYPLQPDDFIHDTQIDDGTEIILPDYQADQYEIEGNYYYSARDPESWLAGLHYVFEETAQVPTLPQDEHLQRTINPYDDSLDVDVLINQILTGIPPQAVCIKRYTKFRTTESAERHIMCLSAFLRECGCKLYYSSDNSISDNFSPSRELDELLKRYWTNGEFRNIRVYKNPDIDNITVNVSQGKIVQTLIDEYENARAGREFRDVFLTAPTGAGKSLLFQLPAFYISERGDMTIVISPLIALMKDQIDAIHNKRHFSKAAYLNSEISMNDRDIIISRCQNGEIDVLYMAPELLLSYDISFFVGERKIGLLVVDEAHTVTTWGRDFRVDYWYLGNHIRKIRKYKDQRFPMIAVTATAVYGGENNDMVFDTVDSLSMHAPHYFIGEVKRSDIEFIINNYDSQASGFDSYKINQTAEFVQEVNNLGFKTLVYAPYTTHVNKIVSKSNSEKEIAARYYGSMAPLEKEQNEESFRHSEKKVMVCTKAFGMGVDIPDIQVVYHHAPSGILPDYIQEIGRAARDESINGYAVINYSERDQTYSKRLTGMSSIKMFQIKAILKKLYDTYVKNGNKRNMLLSVDDFAYAFDSNEDIETKVKTGLMMIEKDYLAKYQYNVVIARPKSLFSIAYALIKERDYEAFCNRYPDVSKILSNRGNGDLVILLHLDDFWKNHYSDISFPALKSKYYGGHLVPDIDIQPRVKITLHIRDKNAAIEKTSAMLDTVKNFFVSTDGQHFTKEDIFTSLKSTYDERCSRELASFVVEFADTQGTTSFIQSRHDVPMKYRVMSGQYEAVFSQILTLLSRLSEDMNQENCVTRYIARESSLPLERIGHILEILNVGNYELVGGEAPMIFIRVNNPEKIKYDSTSRSYTNILYEKTKIKHQISNEIFDHFFMHSFSNEERWNLIEDFFLGAANSELIEKYPGEPVNHINVIEALQEKEVLTIDNTEREDTSNSCGGLYPPQARYTYSPADHLSLDIEGKTITQKIFEWIRTYPVNLYKAIKSKTIHVDADTFNILMNEIERNYPEEYTKILNTRKKIAIPGMSEPEMASLIMAKEPIKFYRWWKTHRDQVFIPLAEKIPFFDKINSLDRTLLIKKDRDLLNQGKTHK